MKMSNYWFVTAIFNFGIYCSIVFTYYGFGRYVSGLTFFTESNWKVMVSMYIGWGLNQVSLSFLFSCFLSDAPSAQMSGYCLSIMACITASTLCLTGGIYDLIPGTTTYYLKKWLYIYPTFPFCRINFLFAEACSWRQCIGQDKYVPEEVHEEVAAMYFTAVFYMILALYLN